MVVAADPLTRTIVAAGVALQDAVIVAADHLVVGQIAGLPVKAVDLLQWIARKSVVSPV